MFRPTQPVAPRKGVILLVVLSMLMLFAIVGVSFVIYANSEAATNRTVMTSVGQSTFDVDPELLCSMALGPIIYDVPDDARGAYSALRGHGIARNMYGYNDAAGALNNDAYSGPGRLNVPSFFSPNSKVPNALNDAYLMNYMLFPTLDPNTPMRDPEHFGWRAVWDPKSMTADQYANYLYDSKGMSQRRTFLAANPSYTYPDQNSFYLAAVKADGTLLTPSYHREWLFGRMDDQTNPNWTNQEGRYLTLRPRPADHAGFPYPTDRYGDVKNLVGAPGGNDSIWIDIGAPVMTGPDGRRYKILVAPLIMDLDNRINVNTAGNVMGYKFGHNSNQGVGPWEVNLGKVLNYVPPGTLPPEWQQVLLGKLNSSNKVYMPGKYGIAQKPPPAGSPYYMTPHLYAPIDYNAGIDPVLSGGVWTVPSGSPGPTPLPGNDAATPPYRTTPAFPAYYANANAAELFLHPGGFNPFRAPSGPGGTSNRIFSVADVHAMLRNMDSGGEAITSGYVQLLPNNFNPSDPTNQSKRRRNMTTPISFDLGRPGILPYIFAPAVAESQFSYAGAYPFGFPVGQQIKYPDPTTQRNARPGGSDFDATTWRSAVAKFGKIDLNRPLTAYTVNHHQAELDRQQLAVDIFNRLCIVTGAKSPFLMGKLLIPVFPVLPAPQVDANFEASRYLAQLAANMVDYIDGDDFNTVFVWNPIDPTLADPFRDPKNANNVHPMNFLDPKQSLVFGTEPPKLVMNEVYLQYDNDPNDLLIKGKPPLLRRATTYNVNVWLELLNPFVNEPAPNDNTAYLANKNYSIYQVLLVDPAAAPTILTPDNVLGDVDIKYIKNFGSGPQTDFGLTNATWSVAPVDSQYSGAGFYVLGPSAPFMDPATDPDPNIKRNPPNPNLTPTYSSPSMSYQVLVPPVGVESPPAQPMVLLRRLVYPNQLPNPSIPGGVIDPTIPYNPYLTVDYVNPVQSLDTRIYDKNGAHPVQGAAGGPGSVPMAKRATMGRRQPYDANLVQYAYSAPPNPPPALPQPVNSFSSTGPNNTLVIGRHNYDDPNNPPTFSSTSPNKTLAIPFNWLTHLDRPLISPIELLQVSAFKPHELTHAFVQGGTPYQHLAPWTTEIAATKTTPAFSSRLTRFFEMVETQSLLPGARVNGRVPGKINPNTVWDLEIFQAIADAQPSNSFYNSDPTYGDKTTDAYVNDVFRKMVLTRTPAFGNNTGAPQIGQYDRPFKPLSVGSAPGGDALDAAAFFGGGPTPRSLDDTLFRGVGGFTPASSANLSHPYYKNELLNKVYNNLTPHSNTFGVFLTVGFFEVVNENTRPVTLGAEIGASEGKNIRHRMFAVVDRTNLEVFGQSVLTSVPLDTFSPGTYPYEVQIDAVVPNPVNKTVIYCPSGANPFTNGMNPYNNSPWVIKDSSVLVIEPNTSDEETVTVYSKQGQPGLFAQFQRPHLPVTDPQGFKIYPRIISRGNPGPWLNYNPRQDSGVVPFFAIID